MTSASTTTSLNALPTGPVRVWLGDRYDTGRELFAVSGGDQRGARLGFAYEYAPSTLTVDVGVVTVVAGARYVLLVRRESDPFRGCWALPGGFVDVAERETPAAAAGRELREETALEPPGDFTLLGAASGPGRDPRGYSTTLLFGTAVEFDTARAEPGEDVADVRWVELDMDNFETAAGDQSAITAVEFGDQERVISGGTLRGRRIPLAFDHFDLCAELLQHYGKEKS